MSGPRIYNLFPLLAGTVDQWERHLGRIREMGFDWVYLNPFHPTGNSGSLYAVADFDGVDARFRPRNQPSASLDAVREFLEKARRQGLRVLMDLVLNHTAVDSPLVGQHPDWFRRDSQGQVEHPYCVDPNNPRKKTVWRDLAKVEHLNTPQRKEQWAFWQRLVERYLELGFAGFRCDAAYQVPSELWWHLFEHTRRRFPEAVFIAETLGCTPRQVMALEGIGFDYLFNSSKYWDFREDWCLEQYMMYREIAPSISFPESHDTPRLAAEVDGRVALLKQRYFFAACFSTGVMIPVGFEFGFRKELHVVQTTPGDWEEPSCDLRSFIAGVNALRASVRVLNEEGPQYRVSYPEAPVQFFLRVSNDGGSRTLLLLNTDPEHAQPAEYLDFAQLMQCDPVYIRDLTPEQPLETLPQPFRLTLPPAGFRLFATP
jgi:starch synthase (maltosyl-transferring)